MVIDSKMGQFGDQVQLISPLWTFARPTLIELTYIMLPSSAPPSVAGLYMYQMSETHSPVRQLFNTTSFTNTDLTHSTVCVPSGTYHLMFLGVQGKPYQSVFGLDIVAFKGDCEDTFVPIGKQSGLFRYLFTQRVKYFKLNRYGWYRARTSAVISVY